MLDFALGATRMTLDVKTPQIGVTPAVCTFAVGETSFDVTCPTNQWAHFVFVAETNAVSLYADNRPVVSRRAADLADAFASGYVTLTVGANGEETSAATGTALDDICAWNFAVSEGDVTSIATNGLAGVFDRTTLCLLFEDAASAEDGRLSALDAASRRSFGGSGFAVLEPGAPKWQEGVFAESDDVSPRAYVQNDADATGYKPNLEHALTLSEDGGYSLYALRTDMNDDTLPPYVLVEYAANGRGAMRAFRVAMTNEWYAWPTLACEAGSKVPLFHPYDAMPSGTSPDTEYSSPAERKDGTVTYRDHGGNWWARRDGSFGQYMRYVGEPGFVAAAGEDRNLEGVTLPAADLANCYDWGTRPAVSLAVDAAPCRVGPFRLQAPGDDAQKTPVSQRDITWLLRQIPSPNDIVATWPKNPKVMSLAQVLSKPEYGLPGVYDMKTCAIAYPFYGYVDDDKSKTDENTRTAFPAHVVSESRVVKLIDPTRRKTWEIPVKSSFPTEYGFTLGPAGNLINRKGYYYFQDMPANVADRLFVDTTSAGTGKAHLCLIGDYVDNSAGPSYLRANSMTVEEKNGIQAVFQKLKDASSDKDVQTCLKSLIEAVQKIYDMGDYQPSRQTGYLEVNQIASQRKSGLVTNTLYIASNTYYAADHYALVSESDVPAGGQHVVLVENDGPGAESLPVTFHVLFVTNSLYCGKILPITDKNNVLSEQLTILYTAPLGKTADQYTFQWFCTDAPSDGHTPKVPATPSANPHSADSVWKTEAEKDKEGICIDAVTDANTGKVTMKNLVNRYWTMHYCAKNKPSVWSNWCQPTLAEGWVQRVLNAITPFSQRLADLEKNPAELKYSMLEQIGKPWEGDVALNNDNLNNVGLVQLYQTILNRAESLSIAQGVGTTKDDTSAAVNKQLVECAARLADMYMILGAEAYSDAQNPLIASSDGTEFPGSVFCFANQVPTLLDEELALLRGRSYGVSPALTDSPFYNRLMWNFTKGVTQGELAYVNNYNISAVDGVLDAAAAAEMYPMGHGDAYGHYLSALKGYYRLLRNPAFSWGEASMMEMLVAGHVINMDYEEEDKFAECAYNLAKIGAEVVNLTARKQWKDNANDIQSGYFDNTNTTRTTSTSTSTSNLQPSTFNLPQAYGYGEWGCRAGYGALCNWAVANALLPTDATNAVSYFKDTTIATVTRGTASSLPALADEITHIENTVNAVDAGLNPLGLSPNAIPFDISPADFRGLGDGMEAKSHYEQIRERVGVALANAKTVLDYANVYGSRLRAIENEEFEANADAAEMEASYERQLIAIYGRPFADDIGPGKTYEEGYTGPDIYHYTYMNLKEYGLDNVASLTNALTCYVFDYSSAANALQSEEYGTAIDVNSLKGKSVTSAMTFSLTSDGLIAMPTNWTGTRACEGSIQAAYRSFLSAYVQAKRAANEYDDALRSWQWQIKVAKETADKDSNLYKTLSDNYDSMRVAQWTSSLATGAGILLSYFTDILSKGFGFTIQTQENPIVGTAYSIPAASMLKAAWGTGAAAKYSALSIVKSLSDITSQAAQCAIALYGLSNQEAQLKSSAFANRKSLIESVRSAYGTLYSAVKNAESASTALVAAQQSFRTVAEQGIEVLAARKLARQRLANVATQQRYADMYARVARNAALSKFSTTYDVAQRYVFELAKVYDYETGLDVSDSASGQAFVNATIATRALGKQGVSVDDSVTDGGLWNLVNRMDANFAQLKGRLGINNPDISTKWFSLRYSNFRISPEADGDAAWREELRKHWTDDILSDARFKTYCEPPARAGNARPAEPGFIFEFATTVNLAENFFGKTLQGGETKYSSSDYAIKIYAAGVDFTGYKNGVSLAGGLADEPNIYLVPIGKDYMRAPLATDRKVLGFSVVDQVLPLPYDVGENELNASDWVATFNGLDAGTDSAAKIRRHSTLRMGPTTSSTRLVGRSVWNDKWLLVIPAAEMNANTETARERFLQYVTDIRLGIQAYSRSGN